MRTRIRTLTPGQTRRRAAIIGATALAVVVGAASLGLANQPPALDDKTLCPTDRRLETSVVILVDTTDSLTPIQISRLRASVHDARDALPTYGKLTLLYLESASPYEPKEIVSLCNPGSARNINPLIQTESKIKKRWDESFGNPVERAIAALAAAPMALRSPIIQAVVASTLRPDFDARVRNRRLLIVSDLLQHDPGYSHYTTIPRDLWPMFTRSRLATEAIGDLSNVNVEVEYLQRPKDARLQGEGHRAFWKRWFGEAGASPVRFIGIPDSAPRLTVPKDRVTIAKMPGK